MVKIFFALALAGILSFSEASAREFVSVCVRTPQVRAALTTLIGLPCEEINQKHLEKIIALDLSMREISALRTDDFTGLQRLERLVLSTNRLKKLPKNLWLPAGLKHLSLRSNKLKHIPVQVLARVPGLETLDISYNYLMHTMPDLSHNPRLKSFDAYLAAFWDVPENVFRANGELKSIFFTSSARTLKKKTFAKLDHLQKLHLHLPYLRKIPAELALPEGIEYLTLSGSSLEKGIPDRVMASLPELVSLDIANSKMKSLPNLSKNSKLRYLNAGGNSFSSLPQGAFRANGKLESINLENTGLRRFESDTLLGLDRLGRLDLSKNFLEEFPENLILPPTLTAFYLQGNALKKGIPDRVMASLPELRIFNIEGNSMELVPNLSKNPKLLQFDASFNTFVSLPGITFRANRDLEHIAFNNAKIQSFEGDLFDGLGKLQVVWLKNNDIKHLPEQVALPPSLGLLHLEGNPFSNRPEWLDAFKRKNPRGLVLTEDCEHITRGLLEGLNYN